MSVFGDLKKIINNFVFWDGYAFDKAVKSLPYEHRNPFDSIVNSGKYAKEEKMMALNAAKTYLENSSIYDGVRLDEINREIRKTMLED